MCKENVILQNYSGSKFRTNESIPGILEGSLDSCKQDTQVAHTHHYLMTFQDFHLKEGQLFCKQNSLNLHWNLLDPNPRMQCKTQSLHGRSLLHGQQTCFLPSIINDGMFLSSKSDWYQNLLSSIAFCIRRWIYLVIQSTMRCSVTAAGYILNKNCFVSHEMKAWFQFTKAGNWEIHHNC